jgi:hypothetical protein
MTFETEQRDATRSKSREPVIGVVADVGPCVASPKVPLMPPLWLEQEEERVATEALQDPVTTCREAGETYVARSERGAIGATIDRLIVSHARSTRIKSLWAPEEWAGYAACSSARRPHRSCT